MAAVRSGFDIGLILIIGWRTALIMPGAHKQSDSR